MKEAVPYLLLLPAWTFTAFVLAYPLSRNLIKQLRDVSLISEGAAGQDWRITRRSW